jgi:hypothetical protein
MSAHPTIVAGFAVPVSGDPDKVGTGRSDDHFLDRGRRPGLDPDVE